MSWGERKLSDKWWDRTKRRLHERKFTMIHSSSLVSTTDNGIIPVFKVEVGDWIDTPEGFARVTSYRYVENREAYIYNYKGFLKKKDIAPLNYLDIMAYEQLAGPNSVFRPVEFPLVLERDIILDVGASVKLAEIYKKNHSRFGKLMLSHISYVGGKEAFIHIDVDNRANSYYANDLEVYL